MPSIDIRCPHCNQKLGIDSKKFYSSLGKKSACPACKEYITFSQDLFSRKEEELSWREPPKPESRQKTKFPNNEGSAAEQILAEKLQEIYGGGPMQVLHKGSGRFGLTIEAALGIPQNSSKDADFMGIELKTKSDSSLQTLFSRTPNRYVEDANKNSMFARHSYHDAKRNREALYTSFNNMPDSLGFYLNVSGDKIQTMRKGVCVFEHDAGHIEKALLSKHTHTAFLFLSRKKTGIKEVCSIDRVQFCKGPSIMKFLELTKIGKIFLDLTMSESKAGVVKDHGFLWRIAGDSIGDLYLSTKELELQH